MRANRGVAAVVVLIIFSLPSCSRNQGEIALRIDQANRLHVLWYPCSTHWHATEVRLYRLQGRFLGDGEDRLVMSVNDISESKGGKDTFVSHAQLPVLEPLRSDGQYSVEVTGSSFGNYLDFRAAQLPSDRWLTSSGQMNLSSYLRQAADSCEDDEVTLLAIAGVAVVGFGMWGVVALSTARARKKTAGGSIPPRPDERTP